MAVAGSWRDAAGVRVRRSVTEWARRVRAADRARLVYEVTLLVAAAAFTAFSSVTLSPIGPAPLVTALAAAPVVAAILAARLVIPAAALVAGAAFWALLGAPAAPLLIVLSYSAGYRTTRWSRTVAAFAAALIVWVGASFLWPNTGDWRDAALAAGTFPLIAVLPATIGRARSQRRALLSALHERNLQLHREQAVVAEQARARERTRIARDMHDSLGHQLTLLSLYSGALGTLSGEQQQEVVALLRSTSAAAMAELRQILGVLSSAADDEAERANARPLTGLDDLMEASMGTGTSVTLTRSGAPRPLPLLVEHAAYRVIQEGLTNAHKHAARAWITVALRYEPDAIVAEVTNGPGGRATGAGGTGQGLIGLAERARLAGGVLYHGRSPIGGYRLAVTLPYSAPAADVRPAEPVEPRGDVAPPPRGDFAPLIRDSTRWSRRLWIAASVALAVVSLGCGGGVWLIRVLSDELWVSEATYDGIALGDAEDAVRARLPSGASESEEAAGPRPPGADCVAYDASAGLSAPDTTTLRYRFCFRDGRLVEKKLFAAAPDERSPTTTDPP